VKFRLFVNQLEAREVPTVDLSGWESVEREQVPTWADEATVVDGVTYEMSIDFTEAQTETLLAAAPPGVVDNSDEIRRIWGGALFGQDLVDAMQGYLGSKTTLHPNELVELIRVYNDLANGDGVLYGLSDQQVQLIMEGIRNAFLSHVQTAVIPNLQADVPADRATALTNQFNQFLPNLGSDDFQQRQAAQNGIQTMIQNATTIDELVYIRNLIQQNLPNPDAEINQRLEALRNQIDRILRDRFMTAVYLYSLLQQVIAPPPGGA
jgi:hypothetical protein